MSLRGAAAAAALLLALSACGGGSGRPAPPAEQLAGTTVVTTGGPGDGAASSSPATTAAPAASSPLTSAPAAGPCPAARTAGTGEPVALRVWNGVGEAVVGVLDASIGRFEADHPGVTVEVVAGPVPGDLVAGVDPATAPSLVIDDVSDLAVLGAAGAVLPAGTCLESLGLPVPELLPVLAGRMELTEGELWGVPFSISTPVLVFNRDRFRAAGLDPDAPPTTPDELAAAAAALVDTGAAGVGLAFDPSQAHWFVEHWRSLRGLLTLDGENGWTSPPTEPLFGDAVTLGDVELLAGMLGSGGAELVPVSLNAADAVVRLVDPVSPAGMALTSSGSLRDLRNLLDSGTIEGDFAAARLPGPGSGAVPGGSAVYLVAGRPEAETAAAVELLSYLTDRTTLEALVADTSYVPVWPAAGDDPDVQAVWERYPERRVPYDALVASGADPAARGVLLPQYGEIRAVERALLEAVEAGADPAEALAAAVDAVGEILDG